MTIEDYIGEDDPYGDALSLIKRIIRSTLDLHSGQMSEGEHANLIAIEEVVRERDNA
jgi:hypothetical protein